MTVARRILILVFLVGFFSCGKGSRNSFTDIQTPNRNTLLTNSQIEELDSLYINFQLRGSCYAYSSDKNAVPSNGEAHSNNLPQKVDNTFRSSGFYLVINDKEFVAIDSNTLGCKLYLVNKTDSLVKLNASDSRLNINLEVLDNNNVWKAITYLPSSGCGNSYHSVILDKNEYWEFYIPIFKGKIKTKLRCSLDLGKEKFIYSNEIPCYINQGQLDKQNKQGYTPTNLMDPYNE